MAGKSSEKYAAAHAAPQGPGDARPTAMAIVQDEDLVNKLVGKVFLITGCSSGIGVETARAIHATGADVYMTVRDVEKGQAVAGEIQASGSGRGKLEVIKLELDSLASVREAAAEFLHRSSQLNVLIANAGVMACPEGTTKDGFETQFGTNHLGHFLLFELLKPALLRSCSPDFCSRVVCLSSSGHRSSPIQFDDLDLKKQGYNKWTAYGQSKTANIYMANEIERRYGSRGLHATSVMPGGIATPLQRHLDPDFIKNALANPDHFRGMKSTEQGAATTVWAAVGHAWERQGGKYLENCSISEPWVDSGVGGLQLGYKPYAYDEEAARRLWNLSLNLVGLKDADE